jgi:hypothetical protein
VVTFDAIEINMTNMVFHFSHEISCLKVEVHKEYGLLDYNTI